MLKSVEVDDGAKLNWLHVRLDSETRKISFENAEDREFEYCGIECREVIVNDEEAGKRVLIWARTPMEKMRLEDGTKNPLVFVEFTEEEDIAKARKEVKRRFTTVSAHQGIDMPLGRMGGDE